jgi:hypothetical protein
MKNKDSIILESLYTLIYEGVAETEKKLTEFGLESNDIKKLIDVDITKQKSDAIKMGEFFNSSDMELDNIISLYNEFVKFKNKGAPETRDFQSFKSMDSLEKTISALNLKEAQKFLKDKEEIDKIVKMDKSLGKKETGIIARWVKDVKGRIPNSEIINAYEKFLEFKDQNIEGAEDLSKFDNFSQFIEFIHNEESKNAKAEEKQNVAVGYDPIYEDDEIAIWDIDNVGKSINIGHNVSKKIGGTQITWCISYPLNSGLTNYFSSYRQGKVGSQMPLSFYFIWSKKMEQSQREDFSFTALAIRKDGEFEITPRPNGTRQESWEKIIEKIPALKDHKELFVFKPLSESEVKKMNFYDRLSRSFDEEAFLSLDEKEQYEYISFGQDIPVSTFARLSKDRKNDYLNILAQSTTRDPSKKLLRLLTPQQIERMEEARYRSIEYKLTGVNAPLAL